MAISQQAADDFANAAQTVLFGLDSRASVLRGAIAPTERAVYEALPATHRQAIWRARPDTRSEAAEALSATAALGLALRASGYLHKVPTTKLQERSRRLVARNSAAGFPRRNDAAMRRDWRIRVAIVVAIGEELACRAH